MSYPSPALRLKTDPEVRRRVNYPGVDADVLRATSWLISRELNAVSLSSGYVVCYSPERVEMRGLFAKTVV